MTSSLRFALLPLALGLGCNGLPGTDGQDCEGSACTQDSGDGNDPETYVTAAHMVAPYGWMGDFSADNDTVCENAAECLFEPDDPDTYELELQGDLFLCVSQETPLTEADAAATTDLTWEGEGQCGLAPDGQYSQFDVKTDTHDWIGYDQVRIQIDSWGAPVTKDAFSWEDSDYLLEGTIASDLSSITYHLAAGSNEETATITLQ